MEEIRWYEKLNYTETKDIIKEKLQNMSRDFVAIGFYLKLIRDKSLFLEDGYKSIWEFAEDNYGIKRSTASRWMAMNDRFSKNGNTPILSEEYISFGKSQLQEIEERIPSDPVEKEVEPEPELYEEVSEKTDIDIAREENQKAQTYLKMAEKEFGQNDIRLRKQKILVAALAGYIHDLDTVMNPPEEPKQPELPKLKNNDQRKEWLRNYKDWGLWYHDDRIDVNYYKYDFEDGSRLVVAEYPKRKYYWNSGEVEDSHYFHLLEKNKKYYGKEKTFDQQYAHNENSETYLVEFLKNLQKGAK